MTQTLHYTSMSNSNCKSKQLLASPEQTQQIPEGSCRPHHQRYLLRQRLPSPPWTTSRSSQLAPHLHCVWSATTETCCRIWKLRTYGLMTITWPIWQWGPVAQYRNIGSALVTGMLNVPTSFWPSLKGMCPLWMASGLVFWSGWHPASWALWVTVWLPLLNWNCTTSPTFARTKFGTKRSWGPPTTTGMSLLVRRCMGVSVRTNSCYVSMSTLWVRCIHMH